MMVFLKDGYTSLIWACREGYVEIAKLLLQRGASLNARNNVSTLLHMNNNTIFVLSVFYASS